MAGISAGKIPSLRVKQDDDLNWSWVSELVIRHHCGGVCIWLKMSVELCDYHHARICIILLHYATAVHLLIPICSTITGLFHFNNSSELFAETIVQTVEGVCTLKVYQDENLYNIGWPLTQLVI